MGKGVGTRVFALTAVGTIICTFFFASHITVSVPHFSAWANYKSWPVLGQYADDDVPLVSQGKSGLLGTTSGSASHSRLSIEAFTKQALENDIYGGPYDGTPLRELCENTVWTEGVFITAGLAGGISNVRPGLLASIRLAIESGAGLLLPKIWPRIAFEEMMNSFDFDPDHAKHLDVLFDMDHLYEMLQTDCPQLLIVDETDSTSVAEWQLPDRADEIRLDAKALMDASHTNVMAAPERWRESFDRWLANETAHLTMMVPTEQQQQEQQQQQHEQQPPQTPIPSRHHPVRIFITDPAFFWPVAYDGAAFAAHFGRIARSPVRLRAMAARVLYRLYAALGVAEAPDHIAANAFFGVHLRTAGDATSAGWMTYEEQRDVARTLLVRTNLSCVYVATGDPAGVERLRADLADIDVPVFVDDDGEGKEGEEQEEEGVRITTTATTTSSTTTKVTIYQKEDFLDGLEATADLSWDQLALIDVEVMLRASRFVGISMSSWPWTLALKRHVWSRENPYNFEVHPVAFEDEYSVVFGPLGAGTFVPPTLWI